MYSLKLTEQERQLLIDALRSTVTQLDAIMEKSPTREVANASNSMENILAKLGEKGESE